MTVRPGIEETLTLYHKLSDKKRALCKLVLLCFLQKNKKILRVSSILIISFAIFF